MKEQNGSVSDSLIQGLEKEARIDLKGMDFAPDNESSIQLFHIRCWYIETEKLIRVLANVLPSTMAQPINQLRYAGHHVLKATANDDGSQSYQVNIVEAFKHYKRAYYDAIDLYVYHMAEAYRDKLAFLADQEKVEVLA